MREKGIHVEEMYFSGFWSQGDGASFSGRISDFALFCQVHNFEVPVLLSFLRDDDLNQHFTCKADGHRYVHSGGMSFESDLFFLATSSGHPLECAALEAKKSAAEQEWTDFVARSVTIFREHADQLYRDLETEYDYLTSDEQVLESLIANGFLEEQLERYEPDSSEEGDEGQDTAPVQELLLRTPGAVSEAG